MNSLQNFIRTYPTTGSFIALSVFISVITWFGSVQPIMQWLYYNPQDIVQGQIWRLLTPVFLHFPTMGVIFAHLAFNMILLYMFGCLIEKADGSWFLLVMIVVSGALSNIAEGLIFQGLFGGMSGVVSALLGYLFFCPRLLPSYPARLPDNLAYMLMAWMVIAVVLDATIGIGVAHAAHFSGFAVGVLFALLRAKLLR